MDPRLKARETRKSQLKRFRLAANAIIGDVFFKPLNASQIPKVLKSDFYFQSDLMAILQQFLHNIEI